MRSISKRPPDFLHDSLHMVQRESLSIHIVFRDEDHPCFRKPRELRPFRQFPRIHHAAVVSCSARSCAFIGTLNLAVVKSPLAVFRQHIETHAAPIEVVRALLRDDMPDDEIVPAEEEPQQKLHPFDIVVETYIEKRIVDQTESLNQRTIFRWNVLLHHPHRVCAPPLIRSYYHSMHCSQHCQDRKIRQKHRCQGASALTSDVIHSSFLRLFRCQ